MTFKCPNCRSRNIETLDYGKKTGGAIGLVGGATSGAAGAMSEVPSVFRLPKGGFHATSFS